jgi:hypothetical protein
MKNPDIIIILREKYTYQTMVSTQEIIDVLKSIFPDLSSSTISWRINQLKKEQLIHQVGRGWYSFEFKPEFTPQISLKTKRTYNRIKPLCSSTISVWDTLMLDDIIDTQSDKHWMFFAVPKDELESLFQQMLDFSKQVFLSPDREIINRYMIPLKEAIVLTPLVSENPLIEGSDYITPTIEGILVNAWINASIMLEPIGYDIIKLFKCAFSNFNINRSRLLRYAARRDQRSQIEALINSND